MGSTRALNPGRTRLNPVLWVLHYPKWPLIWGLSLLASVFLAWWWTPYLWILAVLLAAMNWFYWHLKRLHLMHGDANPGLVIGVHPVRIAVATDLTMGVGSHPAVKIFRIRLTKVCGQGPVEVGTRLATISTYREHPDSPRWVDFYPIPVDAVTHDLEQIKRLMNSFTESEWQNLEARLKQIPSREPGLYLIEAPERTTPQRA